MGAASASTLRQALSGDLAEKIIVDYTESSGVDLYG
jgi:hypothetical protein